MGDLLDALGILDRRARRLAGPSIWLAFAAAMLLIATGQACLERQLGVPGSGMVVTVAIAWAAWTTWHSIAFPRNRRRHLGGGPHPYRSAFVLDIFPGIAIGFSQMLRPVLNGAVLAGDTVPFGAAGPPLVLQAIGLALLACAGVTFVAAWRTLGTARVGFVDEYRDPDGFVPERRGIYGHVRHPLFWSGAVASGALAMLVGSPTGYAIAGVNLAYAVAYNRLEDRRLRLVYGSSYAGYAAEVAAILPRRRSV